MLIGCDYHPSWQQICWFETATGETGELKLEHGSAALAAVSASRSNGLTFVDESGFINRPAKVRVSLCASSLCVKLSWTMRVDSWRLI